MALSQIETFKTIFFIPFSLSKFTNQLSHHTQKRKLKNNLFTVCGGDSSSSHTAQTEAQKMLHLLQVHIEVYVKFN